MVDANEVKSDFRKEMNIIMRGTVPLSHIAPTSY